jgi:general stress protein YciG
MLEQDQHGQLDNSQDRQDQQPRERGSMDNQQAPVTRTSGDMEDLEQNSDQRSQPGNGRTSNRGFAAMSPEKQKQIASEGGRAAHRQGVAHEWNSDEARMAGRKGGQIVSQNREHMSEIGRRGGQSSGGRRSRNQQNDTDRSEQ